MGGRQGLGGGLLFGAPARGVRVWAGMDVESFENLAVGWDLVGLRDEVPIVERGGRGRLGLGW